MGLLMNGMRWDAFQMLECAMSGVQTVGTIIEADLKRWKNDLVDGSHVLDSIGPGTLDWGQLLDYICI